MEYLIGLVLPLAVAGYCIAIGFDRDRSFYPVVLMVIASFYVLFATMDVSLRALGAEIAVAVGFWLLAALGFKKNLWIVAAATAGHGVFDLVHHLFIDNPGMPPFWPGFCMTFDVVFGAVVAVRLMRQRARA